MTPEIWVPCLAWLTIWGGLSIIAQRGLVRERRLARSKAHHPAGRGRV